MRLPSIRRECVHNGQNELLLRHSDFPVTSAESTPGGSFLDDGFLAKLNPTATAIVYSTFSWWRQYRLCQQYHAGFFRIVRIVEVHRLR
jgi:hypothetical protein